MACLGVSARFLSALSFSLVASHWTAACWDVSDRSKPRRRKGGYRCRWLGTNIPICRLTGRGCRMGRDDRH